MTLPSPTRVLPEDPSLEQLKNQAKDLLQALQASDPTALAEAEKYLGNPPPSPAALHHAQAVVARTYGFASWAKLKAHVDSATVTRLVQAVKKSDVPKIHALLTRRPEIVNMEIPKFGEHRALHFAVLNHHSEAVNALMEHGANPHIGIYPNRDATTPLIMARDRGYDDIVRIIEAHEQSRREALSCPNATISPVQDQLNAAIRAARNEEAQQLIQADPTLVKACDRGGKNPLHVAASSLNREMVEFLLRSHSSVLKTDLAGLTPLDCAVLAVKANDPPEHRLNFNLVAGALRGRGAPLTPRAAVALGDAAVLEKIHSERPKSLDVAGQEGGGLLTLAVKHNQPAILQLLLGFGLDADERHSMADIEEPVFSWGSPLWHAAASARYDMAAILIDAGADVNAQVYASGSPLFQAWGQRDEKMKALLRARGAQDDPVSAGLYRDTTAALAMLANPEAYPVRNDSSGATVAEQLLWAAGCGGDPVSVAAALAEIDWPRTDSRWFTMLEQPLRLWNHGPGHWVARGEQALDRATYPHCFKLILDRADPNIPGRFNRRILHEIAACGNTWGQKVMTEEERITFAQLALGAGAAVAGRDDLLESTPLGWAVRWGRKELVELLLAHQAPAEEPDAPSWATPLAWALRQGHPEIEVMLRAHGATR